MKKTVIQRVTVNLPERYLDGNMCRNIYEEIFYLRFRIQLNSHAYVTNLGFIDEKLNKKVSDNMKKICNTTKICSLLALAKNNIVR